MNNIDSLIAQYCPDGVEYKELQEVCLDFIVPMRDKPKVFDGTIPWCRIEDIQGQFFHTSLSESFVSEETIKEMNLKVFPIGTVICSCSASIGTYAINTQPLITNQTFIGIVCGEYLNNKFLFYLMHTMTDMLVSVSNSGTIPYISRQKFEKLKVPIPPLPIQQEIVNILDKFTQLEAELEAELEARKVQYEYYSNKLFFSEGSNIKYKPLGSIANFKYGFTAKGNEKGDARFVRITDINEHGYLNPIGAKFINLTNQSIPYLLKENDLVVARTGATFGKTLIYRSSEPAVYASFLIKIELDNSEILNEYYWHFSKSNYYWKQANGMVSQGGQQQFNANSLQNIVIPIPDICEQKRIVNTLEKFDQIISDLSSGLPAEINARRKQYEYYREKLLTFKPLSDG